jgi:DNA-binding NarL/FixJ family response regulator
LAELRDDDGFRNNHVQELRDVCFVSRPTTGGKLAGKKAVNEMTKRILIVDDSPAIRNNLRSLFDRHSGWSVCGEAGNGLEALTKAKELSPDLIVLDISMPVMDGMEAARQLKQILPSVPTVLFTSYESAYLQREAAAAGVRAVVSKASPSEQLIDAIENSLRGESGYAEPAHPLPQDPGMKAVDTEANKSSPAVVSVRYSTGQAIPESGIYTVFHERHRLPHSVTLLEGETFPRCAKCGDLVEFVLDRSAPYAPNAAQFPVRLFALPDLDEVQPPNPLRLGLPRV